MANRIPTIISNQLLQQQLNTVIGQLEAMQPGYAATLPPIADQPNGRLYAKTGTGAGLYQARGGSWVLV